MLAWISRKWKMLQLYHKYYKESGLYNFILKRLIKILPFIVILILLIIIFERYIIDFNAVFKPLIIKPLSSKLIFVVFFLSETFFGIIPPEIFMIWSRQFDNYLLILTLLALLSYIGGFCAFQIGRLIRRIPKVNNFMTKHFGEYFMTIRKWGAVIIVVAAVFIFPYATICMIAGIMHFPVKRFLYLSLARIARFYIYAFIIFQFIP